MVAGAGLRQREVEGRPRGAQPAIRVAVLESLAVRHEGVAPASLFDNRRIQGCRVVGAEEPPWIAGRKGRVEQRFVPLAFGELVRAAPVPDRLSDSPEPPAGAAMPGHEVAPGRDDPGRVGPDSRHVRKKDGIGIRTELRSQHCNLRCALDHQHGLSRLETAAHEGQGARQEVSHAGIHQRLVAKLFDWQVEGGAHLNRFRIHTLPAWACGSNPRPGSRFRAEPACHGAAGAGLGPWPGPPRRAPGCR